jgi:hypothetical protein
MNKLIKSLQLINTALKVTVLGMYLWLGYVLLWAFAGQVMLFNVFSGGVFFVALVVSATIIISSWEE